MTLPTLKRSKDRKVTNGVSPNGKTATIANAFGLPSGKAFSCPGATSVCEKVCYAGKLERIYKGVRDVLLHNWNALYGASLTDMVDMLQNMVNDFVADCDKADKKTFPDSGVARAFRIHWDGDFFSRLYATAWAVVIAANPEVQFWVYTRSFDYVGEFAGLDNLSLYLSVDSDNIAAAVKARQEWPFAKWAYLSETFASGREEMAERGVNGKAYNCPENKGSIPLISEKGSACIRCAICPTARGDVLFSIRKR